MINFASAKQKIHTAGTHLLGMIPLEIKATAADYAAYAKDNPSDLLKAGLATIGVGSAASIASSQASLAESQEIQTQVDLHEFFGS